MAYAKMNTKHRVYYYRLQTLLIDGGTMVIKKVFDEKKSHSPLNVCLQHHQGTISHLEHRRIINQQQHVLLYPVSGSPSSNTFDISLLTCLLRNVCGLRSTTDAVWSTVPPSQSDLSIEADVVRLRHYRNQLAHAQSTSSISQIDFNTTWSEIEQVLIRLNSGLQNGVPNLTSELASLKSVALDEAAEERFNQEIISWQAMDDAITRDLRIIMKKLDEHNADMKHISTHMQEGKRQSARIEESISNVTEQIDNLHIPTRETRAFSKAMLGRQGVMSHDIETVKERQVHYMNQSTEGQRKLQDGLTEVKSGMDRIDRNVIAVSKRMDTPTMSLEQKHIHEFSQMYFEDAKTKVGVYVKTNMYKEANEQLQKSGIAVLSGHPGEGKSSMATYLLLDIAPVSKLVRICRPADWKLVDIDFYTAVLIDDIFGSGNLNEQWLGQWNSSLADIELAAKSKRMNFVITTRHYILQDAQDKLSRCEMFRNENITTLSSSKLNLQEKHRILEEHLKRNDRPIETSFLNVVDWPWKRNKSESDRELFIGFPECAAMFSSTQSLYSKGSTFFSSPMEFFRKCLEELSRNEDEFMALVFVWAQKSSRLAVEDLESRYPSRLQEIGKEFDYQFDGKSKSIRKYLEHHKDEFLLFNTKRGEYSFSHSVIGDVVGVVVAKEYPKAVVKNGNRDFIMNYVTTLTCCQGDMKVHIEEFRYPVLIEKFHQLLYEVTDEPSQLPLYCSMRIKEAGIENTRLCTSAPTDRYILQHDAFRNRIFIKSFVIALSKKDGKNKIVNVPFVEVFELFKTDFCIEFESSEMNMCLPSLLLAKNNDEMMLNECMDQSILTEKEAYIGLLLATRKGDIDLVNKLIRYGTKVSEDAIQIATIKQDLDMLELLLQNPKLSDRSSHIQNENSPLIMATKRDFFSSAKCLLQGGVDVNYRNKGNVSALDKAVIGNHLDVCRLLLQHGARLNEKGGKFKRTPLHTAADIGLADQVELLLQSGADVALHDHRGEYPVHSAAIQCHIEILRTLLEKDASQGNLKLSSERKDICKGMSLYHFAVWKENQELLEVLKEFSIDPNIQDRYGRTPLYLAAFYQKSSFVKTLLEFADPEIAEKNGYTPLHAAVHKRYLGIVRLLCQCSRVNVNKSDKRGYTPLHLACKTGNTEMIRELLTNPLVDARMVTKKGDTVFHILKSSSKETEEWRMSRKECIAAILQRDPNFRNILEAI